jgi:hypothetical protein
MLLAKVVFTLGILCGLGAAQVLDIPEVRTYNDYMCGGLSYITFFHFHFKKGVYNIFHFPGCVYVMNTFLDRFQTAAKTIPSISYELNVLCARVSREFVPVVRLPPMPCLFVFFLLLILFFHPFDQPN